MKEVPALYGAGFSLAVKRREEQSIVFYNLIYLLGRGRKKGSEET